MTRKLHVLILCPVLALSCGKDVQEGQPVGMKVQFLGGEGGAIPADVSSLAITVAPYDSEASACTPVMSAPISETFQVADLTDLDANGRREAVLSDMPHGCLLFATVEALNAGGDLVYSGRADGIILESEGTRRFIEMTLTPEDTVSVLDTTLEEPAFGLTATALAETDGRVLIAGGFTSATSTDCAAEGYDTADMCFVLTATDRAYVFDQGSARLHPVRGTMAEARALHSATALADGRVLIAGGVGSALLVLGRGSGAPSWASYEILDIAPHGGGQALTSYEIFDPEANAETEDPDRNGDAGRGGFEPSVPGRMRYGRYGHGASALLTPGLPSTHERRAFLAGGFGIEAGTSIDVFSLDHPDTGMGFLTGTLDPDPVDRVAPAAAMLGEHIYVFGGNRFPGDIATTSNLAIAERWNANDEGDEWHVAPVTFTDFSTTPHPEWVRLHAGAAVLGTGGSTILVTGWYGARCSDSSGSPLPTYDYSATTYICPAPDTGFTSTIDFLLSTAGASPEISGADATSVPHALASVVRLADPTREGQVLVAGGITDGDFTTTDALDLYTGSTTPGSQLDATFPGAHALNYPASLGAAVELGGGNVLFVGGAGFALGSELITIRETVELLNWEG